MKHIKKGTGQIVDGNGYSKEVLLKDIDMLDKISLAQIIYIKPHDTAPNHYHKKTTEVFYFLEGTVGFKIDGKSHICEPGDLLVCEKGEVHEVTNNSDEIVKYIAFKTQSDDDTFWS